MTSLSYNDLDLIGNIVRNDTTLVNYSYLSDGTKLSALDGSGEVLVYRGPFVYRKSAGNNNSSLTLESAAFGGGRLTPDGAMFYVTDYLGSVRAVVDGKTGELYKASDYSAFGDESVVMVMPQGNTPPHPLATAVLPDGQTLRDSYTGKEDQDMDFSTGYTDFGARQYSPALRRWMTPDPLSEKYYGVSPYAFCNNNPVNLVDPDGRQIRFFEIARNSGSLSNYAYTRNLYNCETGDYNIIGYYDKDNNLIGYGAIRNGRLEYVMDEVNDLDRFVNNLSTYSLAADFFYLNGTPDNGTINVVTGNIGRGLLQMWGTALRNPVYYLYTASVWGKAFLNVPSKNKVYFGQNSNQRHHTFRHTDGLGLSRTHVKMAVLEDLKYIANTIKPNSSINRVVNVDGKNIQYTVYRLSNNEFNIGRIHEK